MAKCDVVCLSCLIEGVAAAPFVWDGLSTHLLLQEPKQIKKTTKATASAVKGKKNNRNPSTGKKGRKS